MDLQAKRDELEGLKSEDKLRLFLQDLLRKIGFNEVIETHQYGEVEYGKDIIALLQHPVDGHEWHAFVVKLNRISGSASDIEDVKSQIKQCFEYDFQLPNGGSITIDKVKVVSNGHITKGARETLNDSTELKSVGSVGFWDRDKLITLTNDHYPNFWKPHSPAIQEFCLRTRNKLDEEITIKNLGTVKVDENNSQKLLNLFVEPKLIETTVTTKNKYKDGKEEYDDFEENRISFSKVRSSDDNFIITGVPGTGKTRIIEEIIKHYSDPAVVTDKNVLPIQLEIPQWKDNNYNVDETISDQLKQLLGEYYDRLDTDNFKKLILIDSIDFMSDQTRDKLVSQLDEYKTICDCRFIITARSSRGFDFKQVGTEARNVKVLSFDTNDAVTFVTKFFDSEEKKNQFLSILKQNNLLNRIPKTPLTLSLLSILYEEEQKEVPATQTDIYKDFTQILLGKYSMRSREDYLKLNLLTRLLAVISLQMLKNREPKLHLDMFTDRVNEFLYRRSYDEITTTDVRNLVENTGFMYIDPQSNVGFKHISFLEFFASREIYHHKKKDRVKLIDNFTHPNWQNTAVFYAGRSKDMPEFISELLNNLPTEKTKDLASSIGGMGYISQALYLTDNKYRKQLVKTSLKYSLDLLRRFKELTKVEGHPYHNLTPQGVVSVVSYWFRYNFSSKTLENVLTEVYGELEEDSDLSEFEIAFMKFLVASTLFHRNIDNESKFESLLNDEHFESNPTLMLSGDIFLSNGDIKPSEDKKESLKEVLQDNMEKYSKLLNYIIDKPAHEFDDEYLLKE